MFVTGAFLGISPEFTFLIITVEKLDEILLRCFEEIN